MIACDVYVLIIYMLYVFVSLKYIYWTELIYENNGCARGSSTVKSTTQPWNLLLPSPSRHGSYGGVSIYQGVVSFVSLVF